MTFLVGLWRNVPLNGMELLVGRAEMLSEGNRTTHLYSTSALTLLRSAYHGIMRIPRYLKRQGTIPTHPEASQHFNNDITTFENCSGCCDNVMRQVSVT